MKAAADREARHQAVVLLKTLEAWKCAVTIASGGLEGHELLKQAARRGAPIDLVLMDIQMPDFDGIATTRRIRSDPVTRDVPVIALTSVTRGTVLQASDLGLATTLSKPIKRESLHEAIATLRTQGTRAPVPAGSQCARA